MAKTTVTGTGQMGTNWDKMLKRIAPRVERGLDAVAKVVYEESRKLVPIDTEALRDSQTRRKVKGGLQAEFIVGFGSILYVLKGHQEVRADRPPYIYAPIVHQLHKSQSKFLEIPVKTKRDEMRAALLERIHAQK